MALNSSKLRVRLGDLSVGFVQSLAAAMRQLDADPAALLRWLEGVDRLGFGLLRGVGPAGRGLHGTAGYLGRSFAMLMAFSLLMMMDVLLVKHYVPGEAESFARAATVARAIIFLPMPIALAMFPKVVSRGGLTPSLR